MNKSSTSGHAPIFLVGAERSGTTLLRLMLDHHPRLTWLEEFEYAVDQMGDDGTFPEPDAYRGWLETQRIFRATGFVVDPSLDYRAVAASFLEQRRRATGKEFVGATVHRHFDRLLFLWRDAKFIHIVRDGHDVARSCVGMGWAGNVYVGVERWIDAEALWVQLRARLRSDRLVEVRFEDLIGAPKKELEKICARIGIAFDARMLDYARDSTYALPDRRRAQAWRWQMKPRDVQLVEARIGERLVERGYALSGLPSRRITFPLRVWLRVQDRAARALFRWRRYGMRLWALDVILRRMAVPRWHRRVRLALDAIDTRYLK